MSADPLTLVPAQTNILDSTKAGVGLLNGTPAILLEGFISLWLRCSINAAAGDTYQVMLSAVNEDGTTTGSAITGMRISAVGTGAPQDILFFTARGKPNWNRGLLGVGTNQPEAPPWSDGLSVLVSRTAGAANAALTNFHVELG